MEADPRAAEADEGLHAAVVVARYRRLERAAIDGAEASGRAAAEVHVIEVAAVGPDGRDWVIRAIAPLVDGCQNGGNRTENGMCAWIEAAE